MTDEAPPTPGIRLWLDDTRPAPPDWTWVKSATEAVLLLRTGTVAEVSLDHDLGDDPAVGDGYVVASWIEEQAHSGRLKSLRWAVHSANPVGAARMRAALRAADRAWEAQADLCDPSQEGALDPADVESRVERLYADLEGDAMIFAGATQGPWRVWDGPEFFGGGKDLCIGAWDGKWLANMDHREVISREERFAHAEEHPACDPGKDGKGRPGSCPICSFSHVISDEQAANARFITEARSRWPLRVDQLRVTLDRLRRIGILARDAAWSLRSMPRDAGVERAQNALDTIQSELQHYLPMAKEYQ